MRITTAVLGGLVLVWAARISAQEPVRPAARFDTVTTAPPLQGARLQGTVQDPSGAVIPEAHIMLARDGVAGTREGVSSEDGTFSFGDLAAGAYRVRVERTGFCAWTGTMSASEGQQLTLGEITLQIAGEQAVEVSASSHEVAEAQLQLAERQRVLGVFPNFYASYVASAEPLSTRQKFQLAWRFAGDPVAFAMAGVVASSEQRADAFHGYGRGVPGYAKRYGAAYTDGLSSTLIGQAILPAVFHQDPRYFVKGSGPVGARLLYAMASMVICKGDNGHWQPNYSNVLGNFASAGLSNAYYPASNRGGGLVVQTAVMATAMGAVGGMFQEFLLHRMTPNIPDYTATR